VISKSATPLVNMEIVGANQGRRFSFDLWRVGTFVANARISEPGRQRTLILRDPDGTVVAQSRTGRLSFSVTLQALNKSRDAAGNVRSWSLEVALPTTPTERREVSVYATVMETARIGVSPLKDRINELIGEHGNKLSIYGETTGDEVI